MHWSTSFHYAIQETENNVALSFSFAPSDGKLVAGWPAGLGRWPSIPKHVQHMRHVDFHDIFTALLLT